jgi:hypothetical protein
MNLKKGDVRKRGIWEKVRAAYLTWPRDQDPNKAELARRFKVNVKTITRHVKAGGWEKARIEYWMQSGRKVDEKIADKQAKEIARTINIVNKMDRSQEIIADFILGEIENALKISDLKSRRKYILWIMHFKGVQSFLGGYKGIDANARLKKFLRGEADTHVEVSDRDKRMARAYWKAHQELLEQELAERERKNND